MKKHLLGGRGEELVLRTKSQWDTIIFSDESKFNPYVSDDKRYSETKLGAKDNKEKQRFERQ